MSKKEDPEWKKLKEELEGLYNKIKVSDEKK